jgi:tetratricopeptide (TPR) repeat protein
MLAQLLLDLSSQQNAEEVLNILEACGSDDEASPRTLILRSLALSYSNRTEESLVLAQRLVSNGDVAVIIRAEAAWAKAFSMSKAKDRRDHERGIDACDMALALLNDAGSNEALSIRAKALAVKATILQRHLKRELEAETAVRASLELKRRIHDNVGVCMSLGQLGRLLRDRALVHVTRGRSEGDTEVLAEGLSLLAEAREQFEENAAISRRIGAEFGQILSHRFIGECHIVEENYARAVSSFSECQRLAKTFGDVAGQVDALTWAAWALVCGGNGMREAGVRARRRLQLAVDALRGVAVPDAKLARGLKYCKALAKLGFLRTVGDASAAATSTMITHVDMSEVAPEVVPVLDELEALCASVQGGGQ